MPSIVQSIKSINIRKILTVFLAGCLLVISTACSQGNLAQSEGTTYTEAAKRAISNTLDNDSSNQSYQGGINGYNDDPRYNAETAAKTKVLVETAKNRQQSDLGDYVEEVGDRVTNKFEQATRDVPRNLEKNREQAVDYVQDKSENLKENLGKVPGGARDIIDEATSPAQEAAKELKDNLEDLT